jgi:hypothetical protein
MERQSRHRVLADLEIKDKLIVTQRLPAQDMVALFRTMLAGVMPVM